MVRKRLEVHLFSCSAIKSNFGLDSLAAMLLGKRQGTRQSWATWGRWPGLHSTEEDFHSICSFDSKFCIWLGWFYNLPIKDTLIFIFVPLSTSLTPLSGLKLSWGLQSQGESPGSSKPKLPAATWGEYALLFPRSGVSLHAAVATGRTSEVIWIHKYLVDLH